MVLVVLEGLPTDSPVGIWKVRGKKYVIHILINMGRKGSGVEEGGIIIMGEEGGRDPLPHPRPTFLPPFSV